MLPILEDSEGYLGECPPSELSWLQPESESSLGLANPVQLLDKTRKGIPAIVNAQGVIFDRIRRTVAGGADLVPAAERLAQKGAKPLDPLKYSKIYQGARIAARVTFKPSADLAQKGFSITSDKLLATLDDDLNFVRNLIKKLKKYDFEKKSDWRNFDDEMQRFTEIRVRFKALRINYMTLAEDSAVPKSVQKISVIMGHVTDDFENGRKALKSLDKNLKLLNKAIENDNTAALIRQDISAFKPKSSAEILAGMRERIRRIAEASSSDKKFLAPDYHEIRKEVGGVQTMITLERGILGSTAYDDVLKVLSTINGKMGKVHDELTVGRVTGKFDYFKTKVEIDPEIRELMKNFLAKFSI